MNSDSGDAFMGGGELAATTAAKDYYQGRLDQSGAIFAETTSDPGRQAVLNQIHNFLGDLEALANAISGRPEAKLIDLAIREYQYGVFALTTGAYRHAFMSLRLSFELAIAGIYFSGYEIKYRNWSRAEADINWNAVSNIDDGVFSKNFIKAFNEPFSSTGRQYASMASAVYRECSEYVHGNPQTHMNDVLAFDAALFAAWHDKAGTVRLAVIYAFAARFLGVLNKEQLIPVEPIILDALGNLEAVQEFFAKENNNG